MPGKKENLTIFKLKIEIKNEKFMCMQALKDHDNSISTGMIHRKRCINMFI